MLFSQKRLDLLPSELAGLADTNAIKAALIANAQDTSIAEGSKITDRVSANKELSALSAAWFWGTHNARGGVALNDQASIIKWNSDAVDPTQLADYNKITLGVNNSLATAPDRWLNYTKNVKELLKGGNPYEKVRGQALHFTSRNVKCKA